MQAIFTISAIIATAGFFIWKIIAGWLIINLEISLEATRQIKNNDDDWLSIKLLLKKGSTDGLWLKDIAVRICDLERNQINEIIEFEEIHALKIENEKVKWGSSAFKKRKYTIAPEEIFQFGRIVTVPAEKPLIMEAAVFGRRTFWRKGFQWRASVASLPIENRKANLGKK